MSLSLVQQPVPVPSLRKRTSSFSYPAQHLTQRDFDFDFSPNPRPCKSPRIEKMVAPLRRSETLLSIPTTTTTLTAQSSDAAAANATTTKDKDAATYRVLQRHKEDRLRRKGLTRTHSEYFDFTSRPRLELAPPPRGPPPSTALPSTPQQPAASTSSLKLATTTTTTKSAAPPPPTPRPRKSSLTIITPSPSSSTPSTPTPTSTPTGFTPVYTKKRSTPPLQPQLTLPSASSPVPILRTQRTSSPLAPERRPIPGRPVFPRSKPEPDLYRTAIKMRMRTSPEGLKILHMGPRLAMSIANATRELEKLVADQQERDRDNDVIMADGTGGPMGAPAGLTSVSAGSIAMPVLTASWVVVKGEDWEMVDCAA